MKDIYHYVFAVAIVVVAVTAFGIIVFERPFEREGVWINCGLSEISPDFTNEMREACRQARSQYESRPNK